MAPNPPPPCRLVGRGVRLRPYTTADAERFFLAAAESYEHVHAFGPWLHPAWSQSDACAMLQNRVDGWQEGKEFCFAIEDPDSGALIGDCGLSQVDRRNLRANLGYWVRRGWTGRGIATEAARLVARWGLTTAGLHRLEVLIAVENEPSLRVAHKIGAVQEGRLRRRLMLHGQLHDAILFSLVPDDLPCEPATNKRELEVS